MQNLRDRLVHAMCWGRFSAPIQDATQALSRRSARALKACLARRPQRLLGPLLTPVILASLLVAFVLLGPVPPGWAADLVVSDVSLEACPAADAGAQPLLRRAAEASCYALRGVVENPGRKPVVDTDVFAVIVDASGEPVLQNRSRVGSIGDVPPGRSDFALRLAVPAGTPEPLQVRKARAHGFSAPVRTRAAEGDELLPLEEAVQEQELS